MNCSLNTFCRWNLVHLIIHRLVTHRAVFKPDISVLDLSSRDQVTVYRLTDLQTDRRTDVQTHIRTDVQINRLADLRYNR